MSKHKKMFRTEFVSVINLHTKFNMTGRHVSLLKEHYKTKTISIFQAIAILFQSTEEKEDEDEEEEEEEEKEVASMEENYPYETPKPVNKKKSKTLRLWDFKCTHYVGSYGYCAKWNSISTLSEAPMVRCITKESSIN